MEVSEAKIGFSYYKCKNKDFWIHQIYMNFHNSLG